MSSDRLPAYLQRMVTAGNKAMKYTQNLDQAAFRENEITQDAVIANIMAIGECAIKIMERYPDFTRRHPEIPWRDIKNMRNRIAHQYFHLDIDTVWVAATISIPALLRDLSAIPLPGNKE